MTIDELIGYNIERTAEWRRRRAEHSPDDDRNARAAEFLGRCAEEIASLEGSAIHRRLEVLATDVDEFNLNVSFVLRSVGFAFQPTSCDELLDKIAEQASLRAELPKPFRVR
jgi:hypothetical protein